MYANKSYLIDGDPLRLKWHPKFKNLENSLGRTCCRKDARW